MKKNGVMLLLMGLTTILVIFVSILSVVFLDMRSMGKENQDNPEITGETYMFTPERSIVANVRDSRKYIRFNYAVEVNSIQSHGQMNKNQEMITDVVIEIIRSKSEANYEQNDVQDAIKSSIQKALEDRLNIQGIVNIFITEFVIQ